MRALPLIKTQRLTLRLGRENDLPAILDYMERNRGFFSSTDPLRPPGFYTQAFWREQIERSLHEYYRDASVRFFLFGEKDRVLGTANFTQIFRGPFQACFLGYGLDEEAQGKGFMTEALWAAIDYMFSEINLHRIMANYMPRNHRSARVLERLGFTIEGQAKDYLQINGVWEDHVMTSLVNRRWRADVEG